MLEKIDRSEQATDVGEADCYCNPDKTLTRMIRVGDQSFQCGRCGVSVSLVAREVPDLWYQHTNTDPAKMIYDDPRLPVCVTCNSRMIVYGGCVRQHYRWVIFRCKIRPEEHWIEAYNLRIPNEEWCEILGGKESAIAMVLGQVLAANSDMDPRRLLEPCEFDLSTMEPAEALQWRITFEYLEGVGAIHDLEILPDRIKYTHDRQFVTELGVLLGSKSRA